MFNNPNYIYGRRPMRPNNRFIGGGFIAPFLLGGLTGGLLAPAFYPPRPMPIYPPYPYPPRPYSSYNQTYYY